MNETLGLVPDEPTAGPVPEEDTVPGPNITVERQELPASRQSIRATELSLAGYGEPDSIFQMLLDRDESLNDQAKADSAKASFDDTFNKAVAQRPDPVTTAKTLAELAQKIADSGKAPLWYPEGTFTQGDANFSPQTHRWIVNNNQWQQMVEDRLSKSWEETSTVGIVGAFLDDVVRSLTVGAIDVVTLDKERMMQELHEAKRTMSPEDFSTHANRVLDDYETRGVFTNASLFGLSDAPLGLADPGTTSDAIFLGLDVFPAFGAGSKVLKRIARAKGPPDATEAATRLSKTPVASSTDNTVASAPEAFDPETPPPSRRGKSTTTVVTKNKDGTRVVTTTEWNGVDGVETTKTYPAGSNRGPKPKDRHNQTGAKVTITKRNVKRNYTETKGGTSTVTHDEPEIDANGLLTGRTVSRVVVTPRGGKPTTMTFVNKTPTNVASSTTTTTSPVVSPVRPNAAQGSLDALRRTLLDKIKNASDRGTLGRRLEPIEAATLVDNIYDELLETTGRSNAGLRVIDDDVGNSVVELQFGSKTGKPYQLDWANSIQKDFTEKGVAARVTPVDPDDLTKGYWVTVAEQVDTTKVAHQLKIGSGLDLIRKTYARILGGPRALDDPRLFNLANMADAGWSVLKQAAKDEIKRFESAPRDAREAISAIFTELRDGADSWRMTAYDDTEFKVKFRSITGRAAEDADLDAYHAALTIADTAYLLKASQIAKPYVALGYKALDIGEEAPVLGRLITGGKGQVPLAETIYDAVSGTPIPRKTIPDKVAIWRLQETGKYVVKPKNVGTIEPQHVLGRNAGGPRINPHARFFMVLGKRAIMTAFSQKAAARASLQLRNVMDELKRTGSPIESLTNELDDVIANNNDWNLNVENTSDFVEWIKSNKLDDMLDEDLSIKARDGIVDDNADEIWYGQSYDLKFSSQLSRGTKPLEEVGGHLSKQESPVSAMVNQLNDVMSSYAHQNYTEAAVASFNQRARLRVGSTAPGTSSPRAQFEDLFESLNKRQGKLEQDHDLLDFGRIIRRRMGAKDGLTLAMEEYGAELVSFVFDNFKVRIPKISYSSGLLSAGFQSAFGFGNLSQFVMQSSQMASIAAIGGRNAFKAAYTAPALRIALHNGSPEAIKRISKVLGVSEEDGRELFEILIRSGRGDVENDDIRKAMGSGFGVGSYEGVSYLPSSINAGIEAAKKAGQAGLKLGTLPFREGERMSRLTAITTAFLERKAKFPNVSALTDEAMAAISNREQALTFDMSTASKGMLQTGVMRFPSQWMTYSFRAMEALIIGRDLTPWERVRLGAMLTAQGGATGLWLDAVADNFLVEHDIELTPSQYTTLQYGVMDGIASAFLSGVTGQNIQTAMGTRLAPLSILQDLWEKTTKDNTIEALGGPSLEITTGAVKTLLNGMGALINGNIQLAQDDAIEFFRTPSGLDNIAKARGIWLYGQYTSKTGSTNPMTLDFVDGILAAAGVTNRELADWWRYDGDQYTSSKTLRSFKKDISRDVDRAFVYFNEGDYETYTARMKEIDRKISFSGRSPADQREVRRSLLPKHNEKWTEMMFKRHEQGLKPYEYSNIPEGN